MAEVPGRSRFAIMIPSRYEATRFPGKPRAPIRVQRSPETAVEIRDAHPARVFDAVAKRLAPVAHVWNLAA